MDEDKLSDIEMRCMNAYPGPWANSIGGGYNVHASDMKWICVTDNRDWDSRGPYSSIRRQTAIRTAEFIAHAREDIPWLIAEIRRLQYEIETLQEAAP